MAMAAEGETKGEMQAHIGSYDRFIGMMKWGAVLCLIVAFVVILIIRT